jgi:hypothetical protein
MPNVGPLGAGVGSSSGFRGSGAVDARCLRIDFEMKPHPKLSAPRGSCVTVLASIISFLLACH